MTTFCSADASKGVRTTVTRQPLSPLRSHWLSFALQASSSLCFPGVERVRLESGEYRLCWHICEAARLGRFDVVPER